LAWCYVNAHAVVGDGVCTIHKGVAATAFQECAVHSECGSPHSEYKALSENVAPFGHAFLHKPLKTQARNK
jgi:hypothetical protein